MLPSKDLAICFLILWIFVNNAKCQDLKEMSKTLDEMLVNGRSFRKPRDHEDTSVIWQKYEFGTEAGNREEVVVTNISLHTLADITEKIDISINNWQFLQTETSYFINAENSTLLFYKINLDDLSIERIISISTEGHILQFKVLHFNVEATFNENHASNLMAILLVESQDGYFLYWYKIFGNTYMLYSTWPVRKQIQDMEFVREENQYELLLLDNDDAYFEGQSLIDVYGFDIDNNNHRIDIWFCRRLFVPKVFNVRVCPVYGRTVLAFQGIDNVVLYESKNEDKLCQFEKLEVIKSNKLANFACFESGYIEYLAIGGEELRLFHFFENNFQDNVETNLHFDKTTEILWIVTIPLNTYRDESLLLVQFKNLTVTALAWHGSKFKAVPLSNQILNNFDLSKIIVIPKVGFVHTNTLVRIDVTLKDSAHPIHHETETVLKTRVLLEEVFRKQEAIFDETEARFNQSYFKNPMTTGFWNLSKVNVSNATITRHVNYGAVNKVGSINLKMEDISINVTSNLKKLEELETELDQILPNLKNVTNATRITLPSDIELTGDFLVNGTLYVKNIAAAFINNASTSIIANGITNHVIINGQKSFPSIDTNNLTILSLNGIPLEKIAFDFSIKNYSDVNFSKLKQLKIDGHLNFSEINSIKWKELMQSIVWKDDSTIISGETIVEGLVAEEANVKNLNGLQYPENYVLLSEQFSINITGKKYFGNLSTAHLLDIEAINKIDIDDFIILSRHEAINKEITFENLEIDGIFQIDGNITGINMSNVESLLNETNSLVSDVIFENLTVVGNIVLKDSISAKVWSDLDDFLLKTEKDAVIIGNKIFWNDVNIPKSHAIIKSRRINDHFFSEFVTLSTNQQFPYLTKISANAMFGNVTLGTMKKLEDYVTHEQAIASGCLNKILLFIKSSVIDNLSFDTIKQTISQTTFFDKINKTFQQVYFENLTISTLLTVEVLPNTINGINYTDLAKRVLTLYTRQNLTGALKVDNLETDILDAEIINGIPLNTWNLLFTHAKSLYDDVFDGKSSITSLRVTGMITASTINNNDIIDIYKEDNMATVTFNKNVSIENLRIIGFINNLNLSEFIADTVQKPDRNITFIDRKIFKNITCEFLEAQFINGHFVNDILDPNEKQTLREPIVINGSVTVFKNFNTTGKIGNSVFLNDFTDRFKTLEDSSYVLRGNFYFTETASVTRLNISGLIQGSMLDSFVETIIFKNDANVTISGLKLFKNSVTFGTFNIDGSLNDLDLHRFHENVVYIDKPFSIDTKVMFREDVHLQKSLIVKTKLQAITIMGVDIKDLQENVIDLNKPKYFPARLTLDNVTFQTSIKIMQVNDLQMDLLILLNTQQFIMADKLNCTNIIVRNIQISGRINTYYIEDIYADTFMVYGNQNITGCIKIRGNVYAYHDFNAHLINNFNPTKIVSLTANDTLTGNFMFKTPVVLNKSLRILGLLNRISPINWQGVAIKTTNEAKQIIFGKWRVYGNVHFEAHVDGNEFLNKVNVTDISLTSAREHPEIDHVIEEAYEDLNNVCALHLDMLKCNAVNQIYKFHAFDYLKIQEFEGDIHDIRNVEVNDVNYILVNYNICHTTLLSYTQTDFQVIDKVSNFGLIDQWMFFKSNHVLYLLTIAKRSCGRSLNNIWKLENNRLMHVLELGNATDMNLYQDEFVAKIRENFEAKSENVTQPDVLKALISSKNEELNFVSNSDLIVLANQSLTYELQERSLNGTRIKNCLGCGSLLTFKVGIYGKEEYIHYDEEISQDYIYLCKNDISQTRILQTIKARRPKSLLILNFGGSVETLLVFVENNDIIQVYEYTGIEGFVHRNMIQIKIDKLYNFKVRKYNNLEKRHCLAVVHKNRLTILEAKMYGEKLDLRTLAMDSCYTNAC